MTWYKIAKNEPITVSDDTLIDSLNELMKHVNVDRSYDIPYVAGYSTNDKSIFIDRDLPKTYKDSQGKEHSVDPFLVMHEATEKAMLDMWNMPYKLAHQISLRAEEASIRAARLEWKEYDDFMQKWISIIGDKKPSRVPPNLDLTPYLDENDDELIKIMKQVMK